MPHGLPRHWTRLVGRERELVELALWLDGARLVTLTGPGGVGKTRLAVTVANQVHERFDDGLVFVDLAAVAHADDVLPALARALGVRDDGDLPLEERVANALEQREMLLLLDNFEHVLEAGPALVDVLHDAPRVTALVTSRAPLRVRGEREYPVLPLACPSALDGESMAALMQYPALALFVERARDVRPDFELALGTAASVAEICRRLDGLPLALELAAARIRVLSPEALLGRLGQGLTVLGRGPRDLPARQHTLRATIAWSYDLLIHEEQRVLRQLAMFAGDFSIESAAAVVSPGAPNESSTLEAIASLVEKNLLLRSESTPSEPRLRLLETVREYALERLEALGELDAARRAHATCFVALVEVAAPELRGAQRERWLARIDSEMDNLRAAVAWSSSGEDGGEALVRIVCALGFVYWRIRGHLKEGQRWGVQALSMPATQSPSRQRAQTLWSTGSVAAYVSEFGLANECLVECGDLARAADNRLLLGLTLVLLGFVEAGTGQGSVAGHLDEGLDVLREAGDRDALVFGLNVAVVPYAIAGDAAKAHAALAECLALARQLDDAWGIAVGLSNAGYLDIKERKWSAARAHLEQSLAILRRFDDEGSISILYNNLAVVAQEQGDPARALSLFEQCLAMQRRLGLPSAVTLAHLGDDALFKGDLARAQTYFADALRVGLRTGEQHGIAAGLDGAARLAAALGTSDLASKNRADDAQDVLAWLVELSLSPVGANALPGGLSARELEVLRLIAGGKSNRDIATSLTISPNTVARHVSNIFDKIGATNRTEAAAFAHQHLPSAEHTHQN